MSLLLTDLTARSELGLDRQILTTNLTEPIAIDAAPDGRIYIAERPGKLKVWNPVDATLTTVGNLQVHPGPEDGLLCLVLSPEFQRDHWIYLYHSTPGILENRVSRFTLTNGILDPSSQKILLRIPTLIPKPNHSGGGLAFDAAGNLYVGTGDYTLAGQSDGFAPLDRRPGHELNDSERTAANTRDLRGKILRIHPEPDGTYTLPSGNLFPTHATDALPEIYVMGCRNPFRLSVDPTNNRLFWGDVGPDALGPDPDRGPAGFDEFNVTSEAGNFGWPYFAADNKPYRIWNFATKTSGPPLDPDIPVNDSPNNSGRRHLPRARPAVLWYPPGFSSRWPELGSGPRSAMAGPAYHWDPSKNAARKLPADWDGAVFLHEWERGWIKAIWLDSHQQIQKIRPLLPEIRFKRPISLKIGADGALYVLEWGTHWANNRDATLSRIVPSRLPE